MNAKRMITVILVLALVLTTLAGCSGGNDGTTGGIQEGPLTAAVIIGNHRNGQTADYDAIEPWLRQAILNGGTLRAIVCDGEPYGMNAEIDNSVFKKSLTDSTRQRLVEENLTALKEAFASLAPETAETDLLEAVRQAGSFLALEQTEQKVMLILDTGLSTAGLLDFSSQPGMLEAEPSDVVQALEEKHGLPNLSGVEVVMYLSRTEAPQKELSLAEQDGLANIWRELFRASGAASVTVLQTAENSGAPAPDRSSWPDVSTVETAGDTAIQVDLREKAEVFTEEELGFKADSDQLLDETAAKSALQPVADYMKENPHRTVIVMGSTASAGDREFCRELSEKRAEKVAAILTELGADSAQIKTLGLGYEDPWHMEDLDADGRLMESAARQNRKVMVMDGESSEALKLQGVM